MNALRQMLRDGTADSHQRIDRRMGALDLTTVDGLSRLLGVHYLVQSAFEDALPGPIRLGFVAPLRRDLQRLNQAIPRWCDVPDVSFAHPLGYRYVIGGSQLGGRLLHRDWSAATDPLVRAASDYMTANMISGNWRALMAEFDTLRLDMGERAQVVASANLVFGLFDRAATELGVAQAM